MTWRTYLQAVGAGLLVHLLLATLVSAYMLLLGAVWPDLFTLLFMWLVAVGAYHAWRFSAFRSYYSNLAALLDGLERKYLLGSLGSEPPLLELGPLWSALLQATQSVADEVERVEREATHHREYVEGWVHEVKAPIAAARLLAEESGGEGARELLDQLDNIERLVEQAVFYARSSAVEQDYFVRETALDEPIKAVLRRHARLFIAHRVAVSLDGLDLTVFTDRKWLEFILSQILTNAIKYRREQGAAVRLWATVRDDGVMLCIEDNGVGIPRSDVGRVFEKGFTGANGRRFGRSTGMGLFLVRKLCLALGHRVTVDAEEGSYTRVTIFFPMGRLLRPS